MDEQTNGGAWTNQYTGTALSWATSGKTGGTYGYRIRACQGSACSGWSATGNTVVQSAPSATTAISLAAQSPNGSYSMSWGTVAGAATYKLEESSNGGSSWTPVQNTAATSASFSGKGAVTYLYRVSGCNPIGCGPVSASASTQVYYPPGSAPSLSAPAQSLGGSYTVSWGAVGGANTYKLEENGAIVVNGAQLSQAFSSKPTGSYNYRAQACNGAGCGPFSGTANVAVIQPPGTPSLSVPASNTTGSYTVSWTAVAMAVTYNLEQSANGGGWTLIQNDGATTRTLGGVTLGTYAYRVQACNAAGCSGYSNTGTISVTPPPPTPAITKSIKYQWKEGTLTKIRCEVKWTESSGATSYDLMVPGSNLVQYSGPLTSINKVGANYCAPDHVVRACNASGCSAYSSPPYTQGFQDLGDLGAVAGAVGGAVGGAITGGLWGRAPP